MKILRLIITVTLVVSTIGGYAYAQNKMIPVYCDDTLLRIEPKDLSNVTCRRADTRAIVTPIPDGHFFLITDFIVRRNNLLEGGRADVVVGINSDSQFPAKPKFRIQSVLDQLVHLKFETPSLVLIGGERLGARNVQRSALGGVSVNLFVSGYLLKTERFGE